MNSSVQSGLILAEVELKFEEEEFQKPSWLGVEVTNDHRYYNAYLNLHPLLNGIKIMYLLKKLWWPVITPIPLFLAISINAFFE
jgi:hypothetical protein